MDYIFNRRKNVLRNKCSELPTLHENTTEEQLVVKSGFVSLKDRISSLSERSKPSSGRTDTTPATEQRQQPGRHYAPQYATLQELFASKSGYSHHNLNASGNNNHTDNGDSLPPNKKPKIPIMRLSKEDWNVKCWEERLNKRRQTSSSASSQPQPGSDCMFGVRSQKRPGLQVEVFQNRIEDVASKLEKVRDGAPQDEKLYQMTTNKVIERGRSHEWTDLLKQELQRGAHNPKQLRKEIMSSTATAAAATAAATSRGGPIEKFKKNRATVVKSPLGRPIGRILDADSSSDDSSSSSSELDSDSDSSKLANGPGERRPTDKGQQQGAAKIVASELRGANCEVTNRMS